MNTTAIIASIIALLVGAAGGAAIEKNNESASEFQRGGQMNRGGVDERPLANDFVSARPGIAELPNESLSQSETDGLLLMREEEKLARDVYQTLYEKWGIRIFTNIAQSEQTHTEAVRDLLEKYDLTDPVTDDSIGVFVNKDLQNLYDTLVERGSDSEIEALKVGAYIEDLDINDLENLISETDNQDITLVYENLVRGSRNHMRTFTRQLDRRGASYEPEFISISEYESIIKSEQERGEQAGGGHSKNKGGRGWGGGGR